MKTKWIVIYAKKLYNLFVTFGLVWFGISTMVVHLMQNPFYTYGVPSISFQTFFVQAFKIVVDSWKFSILLLYILWDDWPILMISGLNEQLQQQLNTPY